VRGWIFFFHFLFLTQVAAAAGILPGNLLAEDPLYSSRIPQPGAKTYSIDLRLIRRDFQMKPETLDRFIRSTERIFSQCDGVEFKVNVVGTVKGKKYKDRKGLADYLGKVDGTQLFLDEEFLNFFLPFRATRPDRTIDVHLMKKGGPGHQGQAFSESMMDQAYEARWRPTPDAQKPSDVAPNAITLFMKTALEGETRSGFRDGSAAWNDRHSSLLAHELGHILMEDQQTFNHQCPGERDGICPFENLMSSGGSIEKVYLQSPQFKKVLGYTPLPTVTLRHCQNLVRHPWVRAR
jgi:hypothetical protein